MLDDISHSRHLIEAMKKEIHTFMHKKEKDEEIRRRLRQCGIRQLQELTNNGNQRNPFFSLMEDAFNMLKCVCIRLERILASLEQEDLTDEEDDAVPPENVPRAHYGELLTLMHQRWCRLRDSFYNAETRTYDTTKVRASQSEQAPSEILTPLASLVGVADSRRVRLHQVRRHSQS